MVLIRVLGPIEALDGDERPLPVGGPIPTRLLALLTAAGPRGVDVEELAHQLWSPEDRPADATASIRTYVARLRRALGPTTITTGAGRYHLGEEVAVDATRFDEMVQRARRVTGSPAAVELWAQALSLWRGRAFDQYADLEGVRPEAARLEELRAEALEAWFDARLSAGAGRDLVAEVERAVTEFPLRDGFRAQQMTALARAGRQADALRAFQDFRAELTDVGLEPSSRLIALDADIASGRGPRAPARTRLRGYQLGERLGEGAFAVVYRATQGSVGREVAVKQIRSRLADQAEFIRLFEAEAHLVARLEHPHIVPLYDYWREPGGAYLVMRHLEGGSLQRRLSAGTVPLDELVPIVEQVAAALDAAHRAGVIHRDVKPANILLDGEGNAYLSDFGIAVDEASRLDPEAWLSNGSPAYAPPEQLQRRPVGPAADVYALAVTIYEALVGRLPFQAEASVAGLLARHLNDPIPLVRSSDPDLPAAVDVVLQKATSKHADARHQSALELARDLAVAAGLKGGPEEGLAEVRNPYKGLRAFDEADAADFVGRDRLVRELVRSVEHDRAVLVVGPSGSGKSSAVRAGLLPALRVGRLSGSDRWLITSMTPGTDPFSDLESALLRVAVDPPPDLAGQLRSDPQGLARALQRVAPTGAEVVLLIDQFEELFTLASDGDRDRLLEALTRAASAEGSVLRVVATIRADFYDHPLRHPAFADLVASSTVAVHPLAADELERAIVEPASSVGVRFEPGLVAEITADVADQPGSLPLLQYALTELFEQRQGTTLTSEAYRRLGGVSGALARRAEEIYTGLSPSEQTAARRLMGRLVTLGEGSEDTRRRVVSSELGSDETMGTVIESFGAARLLSFDRHRVSREPTVELAHEALIRRWPRLGTWLDDDRADLRVLHHLHATATTWDDGGREEGDLYRGGRLDAALEWVDTHPGELTGIEAEFIAASEEVRQRQVARDRRSVRRLRQAVLVAAAVAIVAAGAGLIALGQRQAARAEADRAEEQATLAARSQRTAELASLVATSHSTATDDPTLAGLLALEAYGHDPQAAAPALLGALQAAPYLQASTGWGGPVGQRVCATPAGPIGVIAPQDQPGPIRLVHPDGEVRSIGDQVLCRAAAGPAGTEPGWPTFVVGLTATNELQAWDADTGSERFSLPLNPGVPDLSVSPDGETIAVVHDAEGSGFERGAPLHLLDATTGQDLHGGPVADALRPQSFAWTPDGATLVVGAAPRGFPGSVYLIDVATGTLVDEVEYGVNPIVELDVSEDGTRAVTVTDTGVVGVWALNPLRLLTEIDRQGSGGTVTGAWFVFSDGSIALATASSTVEVVDRDGTVGRWPHLSLPAVAAAISGAGPESVVITDDRGVVSRHHLIRPAPSVDVVEIPTPASPAAAAALGWVRADIGPPIAVRGGPAGDSAVVVTEEQILTHIDLRTGEQLTAGRESSAFRAIDASVHLILADGRLVTMLGDARVIDVWSGDGEEWQVDLDVGLASDSRFVLFATDGTMIGTVIRQPADGLPPSRGRIPVAGIDHVFILDPDTRTVTEVVVPEGELVSSILPQPDGSAVLGLASGAVAWVTATGVYQPGPTVESDVEVVAMADHGGDLLVVTTSGRLHRLAAGVQPPDPGLVLRSEELGTAMEGVVVIQSVPWADGLVTVDIHGTVRLWDAALGAEIGILRVGPGTADTIPIVDPGAQVIWVRVAGDRLHAMTIDPAAWAQQLCQRTTRRLSPEERTTFVPAGIGAEASEVCPAN